MIKQKEYGSVVLYPSTVVHQHNLLAIKCDMRNKKQTHKKKISSNIDAEVVDEIILQNDSLFLKSVATDKVVDGSHTLIIADFASGEYLSFTLSEYKNKPYFCDIFFESKEGNSLVSRVYDNADIEDMQTKAPEHELLKAMNTVLAVFEGKGAVEKTGAESVEEIQKQ